MSQLNPRQAALSGAMTRFRIMAIYAGVMSLLLWFVSIPTHYCIKARKSLVSTILLILAGTLPVASFVAERRAIKEFKALN